MYDIFVKYHFQYSSFYLASFFLGWGGGGVGQYSWWDQYRNRKIAQNITSLLLKISCAQLSNTYLQTHQKQCRIKCVGPANSF